MRFEIGDRVVGLFSRVGGEVVNALDERVCVRYDDGDEAHFVSPANFEPETETPDE